MKSNPIIISLYDSWFGQEPFEDQVFYQYFIEQKEGSALEIGSGTGRLLLSYIRDGLKVEGIEPCELMRMQCYEKAKELNLNPVIYNQSMEKLFLSTTFDTIYAPLCVFQRIIDRFDALTALQHFYNHLNPQGQLLISLFVPLNHENNQTIWKARRTIKKEDMFIILSESKRLNFFEQLEYQLLSYQFYKNEILTKTIMEEISFRWYHKFEFLMMLEKVGFKIKEIYSDYTYYQATDATETFIYHAIK